MLSALIHWSKKRSFLHPTIANSLHSLFCCLPKYSTIVKSLKTFFLPPQIFNHSKKPKNFVLSPPQIFNLYENPKLFVLLPSQILNLYKKPKNFVLLPSQISNHNKKPKTLFYCILKFSTKFFVFLPSHLWNHCKKPKTLPSKTQSQCKYLWELFHRCTTVNKQFELSVEKQLSNKSSRCENAKYLETMISAHGMITCLSLPEIRHLKSSESQKPKAT